MRGSHTVEHDCSLYGSFYCSYSKSFKVIRNVLYLCVPKQLWIPYKQPLPTIPNINMHKNATKMRRKWNARGVTEGDQAKKQLTNEQNFEKTQCMKRVNLTEVVRTTTPRGSKYSLRATKVCGTSEKANWHKQHEGSDWTSTSEGWFQGYT